MTDRQRFLAGLALLAVAAMSPDARADQRHFVASTGMDTNPCLINLPCRSFAQAAIGVDPDGEIIVQDTAGYGFVTVSTPLSILSPGGVYAGISVFAGQDGVTINVPGGNVRLNGLFINGQGGGTGILVQNAARITVEGCSVTNMTSHGFSGATANARIVIRNSVFRDNGGAGVSVAGALDTTIDAVHADRNAGVGFALTTTKGTISASVTNNNGSHGVALSATVGATTIVAISDHKSADNGGSGIAADQIGSGVIDASVSRSAASGNAQHGVHVSTNGQGASRLIVADSQVTGNTVSGVTVENTTAVAMLHGNAITSNPVGVQGLTSGLVRSAQNNSIVGNTIDIGAGVGTYVPN